MPEWLREWLVENPFLRLQGKRWLRNEGPWWTLFRGVAIPATLVLLLHLLFLAVSPTGKVGLDRPFSLVFVSILAFFHVFLFWGGSGPTFALDEEAREHRLHFLRLLPLGPREFLFKLGLSRAALRLPSLLAPLPVYCAVFLYGHPPLRDLGVLYLLLLFLSLGLPSPGEVSRALRQAEGWTPNQKAEENTPARAAEPVRSLPALWRALGAYGLLLVLLIGGGIWARPGGSPWLDGLAWAVGTFGERNWVLDGLRLAGQPRPFFQWEAAPLWLFLAYWCARSLLRLHEAAQLWATGPLREEPEELEEDLTAEELSPESAREPPDLATRLRVMLQGLAFPTLLFVLLGFLWPGWVGSGSLGTLVGRPTPVGSLAALLLLATFLVHCILLEVLRCGRDREQPNALRALRKICLAWGQSAGSAALFVLLAGLAGGLFPLREMAGVVPGLALAAGVTFAFGTGWRYFRNRLLLGPAGPFGTVFRGLLHGGAWLVTYLLPAVVLFGATADLGVHALAAASPLYLLLAQFAPLQANALAPAWMPWALPVLAGTVLALGVLRRPAAPEAPSIPERDPVMAALLQAAATWDNAVFSTALRRRSLRDSALTVRLIRAPIMMGIVSAVGVWIYVLQAGRGSGQSFPQVLEIASSLPGHTLGAQTALLAAAGTLALGFMFGTNLSTSIAGEGLGASRRQQRQDLRLSPMPDGEIVRGTLWGAAVEVLPTLGSGLVASLFWVVIATLYEAGWHWVPVWVGAAALAVALILHYGLEAFRGWTRKTRTSPWETLVAGLGPLLLGVAAFLAVFGYPLGLGRYLPALLPGFALLAAALSLGRLPVAFRRAERWVKASREEDAPVPLN